MQFASAHAHLCYRCMRFRLTFLYKMMLFETIAFHSANEIGQKQRISFHDVSVVVQRICVFGHHRTSWYTSQK